MTTYRRDVWVLGGTGFIGSALVNRLSQDPSNRIHLLIHRRSDNEKLEGYNTIAGSLGTIDPHWFERYPPDVVFHLARPAGRNILMRNLRACQGARANIRLIRMLSALKKPPVVVYVSGSLMYGELSALPPAFEDSRIRPGAFAKAYYRNEKPWMEAQRQGLMDIRFARPGWIVGDGSWFTQYFWKPYLLSNKVPCYGDGSQLMSVIHLSDCSAMIDTLSREKNPVDALNIFSMEPVSQLAFSKTLASLLNAEVEMIPYSKIKQQYGITTAKALLMSIPMKTRYPEIHQKSRPHFSSLTYLLANVVRPLKNE